MKRKIAAAMVLCACLCTGYVNQQMVVADEEETEIGRASCRERVSS